MKFIHLNCGLKKFQCNWSLHLWWVLKQLWEKGLKKKRDIFVQFNPFSVNQACKKKLKTWKRMSSDWRLKSKISNCCSNNYWHIYCSYECIGKINSWSLRSKSTRSSAILNYFKRLMPIGNSQNFDKYL